VRLKVNQDEIFYIQNAMVACGRQNLEDQYLSNPRLVVEVLSPSTERTDGREKALNYRHIASLEECVLVAQRASQVTIFRRSEQWMPVVLTSPEAIAELQSIEFSVSLERIYEGAR
jgi:Uma2 family endonuclease